MSYSGLTITVVGSTLDVKESAFCRRQGPFHYHSRSDVAHLHMRIVRIEGVGQIARILTIHVKEGEKRGKQASFYHCHKRQELGHEKFGNKCTKKLAPDFNVYSDSCTVRVKICIMDVDA